MPIFVGVVLALPEHREIPPRPKGIDPVPFAASEVMEDIPYSNDFESDITGWVGDNSHDPSCIDLPPISYCSDIQWHHLDHPEFVQVAPDLFPDHINLPEEVIDSIDVAYLPEAHSGTHAWWCGSLVNGTFVGDPYDPDLTTPVESNPYGNSYCYMEAWLVSPIFNTAGFSSVYMSFWTWWEVECIDIYAFDVMEVSISVDGGPWTPIDTLNPPFSRLPGWHENDSYSSGGYLSYGRWVLWTYDLSAYAGHQIQVKFHFYTVDQLYNAFRGWLMDDFYIGGGPEHGELQWEIHAPTEISAEHCRFSPNPFDVNISVWNSGGELVHSVSAALILPGGLHLAGGDSIANLGNLAPAETVSVSWQVLADDTIAGTRCLTILLTSADSLQGYRDNFENPDSGLFIGDGTGTFDYTDVSTVAPRGTHPPSGEGIAGIPAYGGAYPEAGQWTLTTREPLDLTGFSECYINFWQWVDVRESGTDMTGIDGGMVEINVNGTGWQQLDEFATGMLFPRYDGYIENTVSNPLAYKLTYCRDSGGWVFVQSHDLISMGYCSPGDLLEVRFRFGSGAYSPDPSTSNGWYIDDFSLSSTGHPVGPYEISWCITFPVVDPPRLTIIPDSVHICAGDTAELSATVLSGTPPYEYHWFPEEGLSSPNTANTFAAPETNCVYYLSVVDYFGCADTDTVRVLVDDIAVEICGDSVICAGDTANLWAEISGGEPPFSVEWTPADFVISPGETAAVFPDSSGFVFCTVTDAAGCVGTDSFFVRVMPTPGEVVFILPPESDSIPAGDIALVWHSVEFADSYVVVLNGDTLGATADTEFVFAAGCDSAYVWQVLAVNFCGTSSAEGAFYTLPCVGPAAYVYEPLPRTWTSCDDQPIVMILTDPDGVDLSSVVLVVNGVPHSVDGATLVLEDSVLTFYPSSAWHDGETVSVCLDSACDIFGSCIETPVCWEFYVDLSPPVLWDASPIGTVDSLPEYLAFHLADSLSGLADSLWVTVIAAGETVAVPTDEITHEGDSFRVSVPEISAGPGDTVTVCVRGQDSPDYCPPNVLHICWSFAILPCDLSVHPCGEAILCPGDSLNLGEMFFLSGGTPPYSFVWTAAGETVSTEPNPTVAPESTTTYILAVTDHLGCVSQDTVRVEADFVPVSGGELIFPHEGDTLPPGTVQLVWHPAEGTPPVTYDVYLGDSLVGEGITDTVFSINVECGESYVWRVVAHNVCVSTVPHCEGDSVWEEIDTSHFADTLADSLGAVSVRFYTPACDGPVVEFVRPFDGAISACDPESVVIRIDDPDGVAESSLVISVNGERYTVGSPEVRWSPPVLVYLPLEGFPEGEIVLVCVDSAADIYGNPVDSLLCVEFAIDHTPPEISLISPDTSRLLTDYRQNIVIRIADATSGVARSSVRFVLNGTDYTDRVQISGEDPLEVRFITHEILGQFAPGESIRVEVSVCDTPDLCPPNCDTAAFVLISPMEWGCYVCPNPFTPNGDGLNDFAVFEYPFMTENPAELVIFDLRGVEVYHTRIGPVADPTEISRRRWDGTDSDGNPLPQGVYLYLILHDGEVLCNGTIVISR